MQSTPSAQVLLLLHNNRHAVKSQSVYPSTDPRRASSHQHSAQINHNHADTTFHLVSRCPSNRPRTSTIPTNDHKAFADLVSGHLEYKVLLYFTQLSHSLHHTHYQLRVSTKLHPSNQSQDARHSPLHPHRPEQPSSRPRPRQSPRLRRKFPLPPLNSHLTNPQQTAALGATASTGCAPADVACLCTNFGSLQGAIQAGCTSVSDQQGTSLPSPLSLVHGE